MEPVYRFYHQGDKGGNMKALIFVLTIIMISSAAFGTPTIGIYFTEVPGQMIYNLEDPGGYEVFDVHIYAHNVDCMLSAVEYKIELPPDIVVGETSYPPEASVFMGDVLTGHTIAYAPALDGTSSASLYLCTVQLLALNNCWYVGGIYQDTPMIVVPHPGSGYLRGTCAPEHATFEIQGMTSILCPDMIGVETKSWGAIKSLFR